MKRACKSEHSLHSVIGKPEKTVDRKQSTLCRHYLKFSGKICSKNCFSTFLKHYFQWNARGFVKIM